MPDTTKSAAAEGVARLLVDAVAGRPLAVDAPPSCRAGAPSRSPSSLSSVSELNFVFSTSPTRSPPERRARASVDAARDRIARRIEELHRRPPGSMGNGHAARPLVAPAGQARRPASRLAAGADDQDVLGPLEGVLPRRLVPRLDRARPPPRPLEVGHGRRACATRNPCTSRRSTARAQDLGVLAGEDDERLVEAAQVRRAQVAEGVGEAAEQRLRRRRRAGCRPGRGCSTRRR